jgi:hypothetical protein
MKWCWILLKAFSASIEMIKWVLSLLLLICYIHLMICICWTILASQGWSWLHHGEQSFGYVLKFSLPLFYWGFASKFIKEVGLYFFLDMSLSNNGMTVILAS